MLPINNQFISQTFYVALGRIHYAQPAQSHKNILQASSSSYLIENNITNITNITNNQLSSDTFSQKCKIVHKIPDVDEMYFLSMRIENQPNVKIVIVL